MYPPLTQVESRRREVEDAVAHHRASVASRAATRRYRAHDAGRTRLLARRAFAR